ncbi:MAG: fasciclin domain-containing protein [Gemmataceae bacterium]
MKLFRKYAAAAAIVALLSVSSTQAANDDIVTTAVKSGKFKTLVAAVKAAGLVKTLQGRGPFTVFAPTDAAFNKLPKGTVQTLLLPENKGKLASILTYHVTPGRVLAKQALGLSNAPTVNGQRLDIVFKKNTLTIDGAKVVITDIQCSNGVIHVIDSVMLPSFDTIPETAVKAGSFKTLIAAVKAAGLAETLSNKGPFTVFAPTDAAFNKLPKHVLADLLKPENKQKLTNILLYHVVSGRVYSDQAVKAGQARTLAKQRVRVNFGADGIKINDSKVVIADIDTTNGVIHAIDTVLIPKDFTSTEACRMLENAVARGAKMFNNHNHAGCAQVYEEACRDLVDMMPKMDSRARQMLISTLNRTRHMSHATQRAWALRHAIDMTYSIMSSQN